jgi:hypothetical protein
MRQLKISKTGAISVFVFCILSLLGRFLFPFGDEPDWTVRAPRVIDAQHSFFSPYLWARPLLTSINTNTAGCVVDASPFSIWGHVSGSCTESIDQILIRFFLTVFVMAPLFFAIIFRFQFIKAVSILGISLSRQEWEKRLTTLSLTLLFPGVIFYLGVFAEEQFFLVAALFLFLFWGFKRAIIPIFFLLLSIDFGNSIVVIFFIGAMYFFKFILKKFGKTVFYFGLLTTTLSAYIIGFKFLTLFSFLPLGTAQLTGKANAMYLSLESGLFVHKYPVILRPLITFMSMTFMTPSGLKSVISYVIIGILSTCFLFRLNFTNSENSLNLRLYLFTPIFIVLFIVFLFPTYANAKYYMFLLPFIFYVALSIFNKKNILILFSITSFIVMLNLLLYRI